MKIKLKEKTMNNETKFDEILTLEQCLTIDMRKFLNSWATPGAGKCWIKKSPHSKSKLCLVAHVDTVHESGHYSKYFKKTKTLRVAKAGNSDDDSDWVAPTLYHDKDQGVFWSPDGLGADDRAGVYALLTIWATLPEELRPMLLFTDEEESGGHGAEEAGQVFSAELSEVSFFIEMDRRGRNDCVFYNGESGGFIDMIESYGFRYAQGIFSDITIIGWDFNVCSVNLSVGYYNEHTKHEYLKESELRKSMERVMLILANECESDRRLLPPMTALDRKFRNFDLGIDDSLSDSIFADDDEGDDDLQDELDEFDLGNPDNTEATALSQFTCFSCDLQFGCHRSYEAVNKAGYCVLDKKYLYT